MWPEHVEALELFMVVSGQWRVAAGFAVFFVGLDYSAVEAAMNMRGVKRAERQRLFAEVRVMESAALKMLNRKSNG